MSEVIEVLFELRDLGIRQLPETGDAGERRLRERLGREMARGSRAGSGWLRRKLTIGGFGVPVVVLGVVATAAAATGALVATDATTVFQNNPQAQIVERATKHHPVPAGMRAAITTAEQQAVIPSSVREIASVPVPNYGQVQFWAAITKQGGFCFALKLPDGSWGGLPLSDPEHGGWDGGTVPGCAPTRQQQIVSGAPLVPGPAEYQDQEVKTSTGQIWELFMGYATAQGKAATVKDPVSGATAPVTTGGYFLLAEPPSSGDDSANLEILNASGEPLQADYTGGHLLPGYGMGPTPGTSTSGF